VHLIGTARKMHSIANSLRLRSGWFNGNLYYIQKGGLSANKNAPTISSTYILPLRWNSSIRSETNREPLRVAIVGGGATGLSTALHLAPLVERGIIAKPIDLYEKSSLNRERDVGVGVWSTALEPFMNLSHKSDSPRKSHVEFLNDIQRLGSWVRQVGYRNPTGEWLSKSTLDDDGFSTTSDKSTNKKPGPSLLFIQEKDFLSALSEAVLKEQRENGTIKVHCGESIDIDSTKVEDINIPNSSSNENGHCGQLVFDDGTMSSKLYNLIVSAEGTNSSLRLKYSGYCNMRKRLKQKHRDASQLVIEQSHKWLEQGRLEHNLIEDRHYTVFRGNSPLGDAEAGMDKTSFQTWGRRDNMRFAAVGMSHPSSPSSDERTEKQVWFATISSNIIGSAKDAFERKELLMDSFKDWHQPISKLIESTPTENIIVETAVAHKYTVRNVTNIHKIHLYNELTKDQQELSFSQIETLFDVSDDINRGPILVLSGDANMTVDPVLAQGFTIGMETAADLSATLEQHASKIYDFKTLASVLYEQNERRHGRIMCLLRATELVSQLAQPTSGSLSGIMSNIIIRPLMRITPNSLKESIFTCTMKYSLGLYGDYLLQSSTAKQDTKEG